MKNSKKIFAITLIIFVLAISIFFYLKTPTIVPDDSKTDIADGLISISASSTTIRASVAEDQASQEAGLGGRESMPEDQGMLFIFDQPGIYGFWMKDMLFPIDIIWIDQNKTIIGIEEAISPETYPESYFPVSDASYVLELNAGITKKLGWIIGTTLSF